MLRHHCPRSDDLLACGFCKLLANAPDEWSLVVPYAADWHACDTDAERAALLDSDEVEAYDHIIYDISFCPFCGTRLPVEEDA